MTAAASGALERGDVDAALEAWPDLWLNWNVRADVLARFFYLQSADRAVLEAERAGHQAAWVADGLPGTVPSVDEMKARQQSLVDRMKLPAEAFSGPVRDALHRFFDGDPTVKDVRLLQRLRLMDPGDLERRLELDKANELIEASGEGFSPDPGRVERQRRFRRLAVVMAAAAPAVAGVTASSRVPSTSARPRASRRTRRSSARSPGREDPEPPSRPPRAAA